MDRVEYERAHRVTKSKKSWHILMATVLLLQLLVSFSVLSLVFFYFSSLFHLHRLQSFNFKFKFYTHPSNTNKIFMFLLCNGILGVLLNSSGLIGQCSAPSDPRSTTVSETQTHNRKLTEEKIVAETSELPKDDCRPQTTQQEEGSQGNEVDEEQQQQNLDMVISVAPDQDQELDQDDEDDEESREVLKKKCDDFIKKMRLEITFGDA